MKRAILLSLAVLLMSSGCKKDAPDAGLPPATQSGANTAGCFIDGERFIATGWGGSLLSNPIPPLGGGFFYDSLYYLRVNGIYRGKNSVLSLFFRSQTPGSYNLNQSTLTLNQGGIGLRTLNHASLSSDGDPNIYVTNAQHTGKVLLTSANRSNGISAGTFEFTAASQMDPTKTVTVTSGRFDRKQ